MVVKLGANIWLVLTAVVVFPTMLYLTRQAPVDGYAEPAGISQSGKLPAPIQENKQAVAPFVAERAGRATPSEKHVKASMSYSVPADSLDMSSNIARDKSVPPLPRRAETYQDDTEPGLQPEIDTRESANLSIESPAVNTATINYYTVGNADPAQKTTTPMVESSAADMTAKTKKQSGSSSVTSQSRVASVDNSILSPLYTAKIQAPQNIKPKCPPVYMSVNAYARNMRIAMGCTDN